MFTRLRNWWNYAPVTHAVGDMILKHNNLDRQLSDQHCRLPEGYTKDELIKQSQIIRDALRQCTILISEKK